MNRIRIEECTIYYETDATNAADALDEFDDLCDENGICIVGGKIFVSLVEKNGVLLNIDDEVID